MTQVYCVNSDAFEDGPRFMPYSLLVRQIEYTVVGQGGVLSIDRAVVESSGVPVTLNSKGLKDAEARDPWKEQLQGVLNYVLDGLESTLQVHPAGTLHSLPDTP